MEGLSNAQLANNTGIDSGNMTRYLKKLKKEGLIYEGKQECSKRGMDYKHTPCYISLPNDEKYEVKPEKVLENFRDIIYALTKIKKDKYTSEFFKSKYVDELIKNFGFITIFNILKKYMDNVGNETFKKIASKSILNQRSIKAELKRYPIEIIISSKLYAESIATLNPYCENIIKLLQEFDPIEAITFYREKIDKKYSRIFSGLHKNYFPQSIKKYVELDILLSPFTSYPVDDPIRLLFSKPFERLYDNVYLMNESDYQRFIQRAYVFYSHFGEVLFYSMRYLREVEISNCDYKVRELERKQDATDSDFWDERDDEAMDSWWDRMESLLHNEKPIDTLLKASIFYWNITSNRIDSLCQRLNYRENCNGSGKNHILTDENGLKVIDLRTSANIISPNESKEIIGTYLLMDVLLDDIKDPFTYLRPCNVFADVGYKAEIKTYEELLADLRSRMQ